METRTSNSASTTPHRVLVGALADDHASLQVLITLKRTAIR